MERMERVGRMWRGWGGCGEGGEDVESGEGKWEEDEVWCGGGWRGAWCGVVKTCSWMQSYNIFTPRVRVHKIQSGIRQWLCPCQSAIKL